MIAGLYLGEVFRLILCELIDNGDLFLGQNTYKLEKAYAFDTAFLSLMESDPTDELLTVIGVFTHFFGLETTDEERQFFKKLAALIGTRAARLSACGIAAIVSKKGYLEKGCAVGADGSLYNVSLLIAWKMEIWLMCRNTPSSLSVYTLLWSISLVKRARTSLPTTQRMDRV
jgi:hexokinase